MRDVIALLRAEVCPSAGILTPCFAITRKKFVALIIALPILKARAESHLPIGVFNLALFH
jgi:hypothetical protein